MNSSFKFKGWPVALITALVFALQFTASSRVWTMLFTGLALMLSHRHSRFHRSHQNRA
ncbi:MAG TPA: hypothetical protein G4N96_00520 [Chloroflexi bacterium]|nr:hypothetical protein [Chloroflexota bacterium]